LAADWPRLTTVRNRQFGCGGESIPGYLIKNNVDSLAGCKLRRLCRPCEEKILMPDQLTIPKIGIPELDNEHARLLHCLERLQLFIENGHGFAASIDSVMALKQYTIDHFSHEERYLANTSFPKFEEHAQQHHAITYYVETLIAEMLDGKEIQVSLVEMMREWILKHIGVEDMEFAIYLGTTEGNGRQLEVAH
jgi:hemerythrin